MEVVYKKISELPLADVPLSGTELIGVSATGSSRRAVWSNIFGAGWWNMLKATYDNFLAPFADFASHSDTSTISAQSESVNGLSFADGPASSGYGEWSIAAGAAWSPPKGLYVFSAAAVQPTALDDLVIEMQDESNSFQGRARLGGLWCSNGVSLKIRNNSEASLLVLFQKLA